MKELIFRYGLLMCLIVPMITVFQVDVCNALPDVEDPSNDINWSTVTGPPAGHPLKDGNTYAILPSKVYYADSNLIYGHCKTDAGTELCHQYYENDYNYNSSYQAYGNAFWDWFFPEATRITNATAKVNCIAYAMDGFSGNANYDYWMNPEDAYETITDDCDFRDPYNQVEESDRLVYLGDENITHIAIILEVDEEEKPTCLEWQDGSSGVYQLDVSLAANPFSTPRCVKTNDSPLQGDYDLDHHDGDDAVGIYPNP